MQIPSLRHVTGSVLCTKYFNDKEYFNYGIQHSPLQRYSLTTGRRTRSRRTGTMACVFQGCPPHGTLLCRSWRSIHICNINITDRPAATWHPATGNDVCGSGPFLSQQQSYTDLWFKGGRFQQRRAAIWAFLWPGGAHTEEFRSLPTGSSTGSSIISNFA